MCIMLCMLLNTIVFPAFAHTNPTISVEIIDEHGTIFPVYETGLKQQERTYRRYLEATRSKNYSIRIRNNSASRLGLVIAVDGRNIISGKKSWLKQDERMYVLGPWQSASYEGWRSSESLINRFYFTDAKDSYAGAWKDHSAMGVIALAVFEENKPRKPKPLARVPADEAGNDKYGDSSPLFENSVAGTSLKKESRKAGTGYGEEKYSQVRLVNFSPKQHASEKHFLKYEWHSTLCEMGVLQCTEPNRNRFWPEKLSQRDFVPPPPGN